MAQLVVRNLPDDLVLALKHLLNREQMKSAVFQHGHQAHNTQGPVSNQSELWQFDVVQHEDGPLLAGLVTATVEDAASSPMTSWNDEKAEPLPIGMGSQAPLAAMTARLRSAMSRRSIRSAIAVTALGLGIGGGYWALVRWRGAPGHVAAVGDAARPPAGEPLTLDIDRGLQIEGFDHRFENAVEQRRGLPERGAALHARRGGRPADDAVVRAARVDPALPGGVRRSHGLVRQPRARCGLPSRGGGALRIAA